MSNPLFWAANLIQSITRLGVTHAVISPGSRSTPLAIATFLHPSLQTHVVLDERSAAFIAMGIGKSSGLPALLICTSGTAAANYFPAVIEARQSGVPMVILSADRPPHLRGIGSSQTIDQLKLYGDYAVFFHEAGEPADGHADLKRLHAAGKQAVERAVSLGGASHINLPFRKPLEPSKRDLDRVVNSLYRSEENNHLTSRSIPDPTTASSISATINDSSLGFSPQHMQLLPNIKSLLLSSKKPLILAGPALPHHCLNPMLQNLQQKMLAPVLAEPGSGITSGNGSLHRFEQFLSPEPPPAFLKPDLIIRFGDQPFTRSLSELPNRWPEIPVIHFSARPDAQDQTLSVTEKQLILPANSPDISFLEKDRKTDWLETWKQLDSESEKHLETVLSGYTKLTDGHLFSHLDKTLPESWNCMISNSFPVRDTALFGRCNGSQFVNRGAAGIDGILSTALGIHVASDSPTVVVTGDLAFLHDNNALLSVKDRNHPLVVVVVNNGGGTIFRMLPLNRSGSPFSGSDTFTRFFETPQHAEIQNLAAANQIAFQKITSLDELHKVDLVKIDRNLIIECVTDADLSMKLRNHLWRR